MIEVYDIETIYNFFSFASLDIDTKKEYVFIIHKSKNDLKLLIEHLKGIKGQIGFNNLAFDAQVVQYIINNHEQWLELDGEEIAKIIYRYSQYVINKANSKEWLDYPEWKLTIPQRDLYKIWHFDNKAKFVSLKWVQYSIDYPNIEEMPISHDTIVTEDMIPSIIDYNLNDVRSTYEFFKITKGETDNILYKGVDKIQLRHNIKDQFNIKCMNYNDVKIGDEINKINYIKNTGISNKKEIPRPIKKELDVTFGECYPSYTKFNTIEFNNFIDSIRNIKLQDKKKQEFIFSFNGTKYTIAKGGLHSNDSKRVIIPKDNEILRDADIQSQYPNAIRKRQLYPPHLGPIWLKGYNQTIVDRINAKNLYKKTKDPKYQAIQEAYKLSLNGGGYGKLGEEYNWQYSPLSMYMCTIGNQIEILMLIESLETNGIHVVTANTDGITCLFTKDLEDKYYSVCKEWELIVGNSDLGQLEFVDYKLLAQTSVNDYIAIKPDNSIKTKGDFVSDFELHKNKSARVVPLALQEYFKGNKDYKGFIENHINIFDFCLGVKSKGGAKFVSLDPITNTEVKLQKVNRYYISNKGTHLLKRLKALENKKATISKISRQLDIFGNLDTGIRESEVNAGWLSTIYNRHIVDKDIKDYDINYSFYINKVEKIIKSIQDE